MRKLKITEIDAFNHTIKGTYNEETTIVKSNKLWNELELDQIL